MAYRIGHGYDVHRMVAGRKLVLGGVEIPHDKGLLGHSDADVLVHAVADALLGALGLGDIGHHFPDTDERFRGMDSLVLLREVNRLVQSRGYLVSNVDSTVILQAPKIAPHVAVMRQNIARALEVNLADVSIKATTSEGLGFTGSGEGVVAHAVVLVVQR